MVVPCVVISALPVSRVLTPKFASLSIRKLQSVLLESSRQSLAPGILLSLKSMVNSAPVLFICLNCKIRLLDFLVCSVAKSYRKKPQRLEKVHFSFVFANTPFFLFPFLVFFSIMITSKSAATWILLENKILLNRLTHDRPPLIENSSVRNFLLFVLFCLFVSYRRSNQKNS